LRGAAQIDAIRGAAQVLGEVRPQLVFLGGCVLGLYARPHGSNLRTTDDVDCVSTVVPWIRQEQLLADLCSKRVLVPDMERQHRYRVAQTGLVIDVLSPDGMNIGGGDAWLRAAADHAAEFDLGDGETIRAVTPPYFLALKLSAFIDRGADVLSSKDMEDIVFLAVEVDGLVAQVETAGIGHELRRLWHKALAKHQLDERDLRDVVDAHLGKEDRIRRDEVVGILRSLAGPT
jgi:predicted nucleotidyltransferase